MQTIITILTRNQVSPIPRNIYPQLTSTKSVTKDIFFSQINTVEKLIDELCSKLREVEKEEDSEDDDLRETTNSTNKLDQADPTKRYYNAFPALSKDMEDSVGILKNNCKSLTWPKTSQKQQQLKQKSELEKLNRRDKQQEEFKPVSNIVEKTQLAPNFSSVNTTGVKRKPKRRRNQGL